MGSIAPSSQDVARERLQALVPTLSDIRETTATPSFSAGVLHNGSIIFTHHEGVRDVDSNQPSPVDEKTIYMLGSLTKAFVSASCGILVDEGKLNWESPISQYIPFKQTSDPIISSRANLLDALSHSTGFPQIDVSWYGAQGETIIPPEELLHIVNNIPVFPDFRAKFHYTNWMYALVGRIIEAHGGKDADGGWGAFVRRRILQPLQMSRSCSNRADLPDTNFAEPHTALDNGKPGRLPVPQFSDKTLTGASAAVWSTVPDLLKWASAILNRLEIEDTAGQSTPPTDSENPLRQMSTIMAHRFHVTENTVNENSYALGWARHIIPSSHLGWLSTNGPQQKHIIGKQSRPRMLFYHGGQITGYLNSLYIFPETKSAVVVLTNAQGAGDCSDLVARAIIQELFDLQPSLDFRAMATDICKEQLGAYGKMKSEYESHRKKDTPCPQNEELIGRYVNTNIRVTLSIFQDQEGLAMDINERASQRHRLTHYHDCTFGFLPASREEQQLRCLVDYFVYTQFLISFHRTGGSGEIKVLSWKMQEDFPALHFEKTNDN
ncbi:beta-lactamase/transpeptidase-like protein [Ilyonectria sp. MPI-CAGE-AT-0026]|nr:beta-lactamase/transpeptidase-like protein [Ilyonectria sp. MPI-CAGE-AT-0026]